MAQKRRAVSKKLRFEVFKRDAFKCQYCGREAPDVVLEADHIEPVAAGGASDLLNLVTSCHDCNGGKGARLLPDTSVAAKSRAQIAELQERREQLDMLLEWRGGLRDLQGQAVAKIAAVWASLVPGYHLNEIGTASLRKLLAKHSAADVMTAMETAVNFHLVDGITNESVNKAWEAVGGILRVNEAEKAEPGIRELYYIRGIFRKRMSEKGNFYGADHVVLNSLREARRRGMSVKDLREVAIEARNWTDFNYLIGAR